MKLVSPYHSSVCKIIFHCLVLTFQTTFSSFHNKMAVTSTTCDPWLVTNDGKVSNKKPKRIVKHKKKAWRVTSNISDVEQFLETKRREERTG